MEEYSQPYQHNTNRTQGFMSNPQMVENVKYILNANDILFQVELFLRGQYYDKKRNEYVTGRQLVNEYGMAMILQSLHLRLSRITRLSRLDDKEIFNIIIQYGDTLNDLLTWNSDDFELKEIDIDLIYHEVLDVVYMAMKQAKNGGLQDFFTKTAQMSEVSNLQQRGGILDMFKSGANKITGKGGN